MFPGSSTSSSVESSAPSRYSPSASSAMPIAAECISHTRSEGTVLVCLRRSVQNRSLRELECRTTVVPGGTSGNRRRTSTIFRPSRIAHAYRGFTGKHAMPHLERSTVGTIVLIASDAALVAFEGMAAYSTSKGAVVMLAKSIAVDHPDVRVNALCPGIVDTPMSRSDLGREDLGFEGSGLPVMRASQLARHALFLVSPVSAPIKATTLVSDFGYVSRSTLGGLGFPQ